MHCVDRVLVGEPEVDRLPHRLNGVEERKLHIATCVGDLRRGHQLGHSEQSVDVTLCCLRKSPLGNAEHRERRDQCGDETEGDELVGTLTLTPLGHDGALFPFAKLRRHPCCFGDAGVEELPLGFRQRERCHRGPAVKLIEAPTSQQVARCTVCRDPLPHRIGEAALVADVVPGVVDPLPQARPFGQKRLVRDLDGGASRDRIPVEAEQPMATEGVEHGVQHRPVDGQLLELGLQYPASGVVGAVTQRHEPEEDLPRCIVGLGAEPGQQAFGSLHERARHSPELVVGSAGDPRPLAALEQLGQGVLQQRQGPGAVDDVSHQLPHQSRLERHTERLGGTGDRPLELARCHRRDDLCPGV